MEKFKIVCKLQFREPNTSYLEILDEANKMKTAVENQLKLEGVYDSFEVVIEIDKLYNSIDYRVE